MLQRSDIKALRARYEEQRHHFTALAHDAERFAADVLRRPQIRHMVASRAKGADSLERKLWKERERWALEQFREGLSPPLKDLSAARVLLYLEEDVGPAVQAIVREVAGFGRVLAEPVAYDAANRPSGYRAVHMHVPRAAGQHAGIPCEIQVCTLTAHVWNELEHDIVYKQPDGKADETQKALLFALHGALDLSAHLAERLMVHTNQRIADSGAPIDGPEALRRTLEGREGQRVLRGDFTALFDLLDGLVGR